MYITKNTIDYIDTRWWVFKPLCPGIVAPRRCVLQQVYGVLRRSPNVCQLIFKRYSCASANLILTSKIISKVGRRLVFPMLTFCQIFRCSDPLKCLRRVVNGTSKHVLHFAVFLDKLTTNPTSVTTISCSRKLELAWYYNCLMNNMHCPRCTVCDISL